MSEARSRWGGEPTDHRETAGALRAVGQQLSEARSRWGGEPTDHRETAGALRVVGQR